MTKRPIWRWQGPARWPERLRQTWHAHTDRALLVGAALALAATLMRPGVVLELERFEHVVVLDITQSMNVQDESVGGRPASRLAFARQALRDVLLRLPCGSKIGWGVFTEHRSYLLLAPIEVCAHLSELRETLAAIDGPMAWAGNSEIAKGLHSGLVAARALPGTPSLVFVSDGHESPPLHPRHRPGFDGTPGQTRGLIVGVGGLTPSPIPKSDPQGRPLGFWRADEVAQTDPYSSGRAGSVAGEPLVEEAGGPAVSTPVGATPGAEHLSALHEPYLRLLASEQGLVFHRLVSAQALAAAMTAPAFARAVAVRADLRVALAALAFGLLLARHAGRRGPSASEVRRYWP